MIGNSDSYIFDSNSTDCGLIPILIRIQFQQSRKPVDSDSDSDYGIRMVPSLIGKQFELYEASDGGQC